MALKKYRFAIGNCGPTILYTNIIRALDEESAAKAYLSEAGKELTEENLHELLQHVCEITSREKRETIMDCMGKEIALEDEVVFIKNKSGETPKLMMGTVDGISGRSIVIKTRTGENNRLILSEDDSGCLSRVVVMSSRPEREKEGVCDASGYPVRENDPIVFMKPIYINRCDGFQAGMVSKIAKSFIAVNGTRRAPERVVVINW